MENFEKEKTENASKKICKYWKQDTNEIIINIYKNDPQCFNKWQKQKEIAIKTSLFFHTPDPSGLINIQMLGGGR